MSTNNSISQVNLSQLQSSAMFRLSLSSKELFHSNFLEWLCYIDKERFIRLISEFFSSTNLARIPEWNVKREYKNFDLSIVGADDNVLFVIENKVKSFPRIEQLDDYYKSSETAQHLLLTLVEDFPHKKEILAEGKWKILTYAEYAAILKKCYSDFPKEYERALINDYRNFIEQFSLLANEWAAVKDSDNFLPTEMDDLKTLRIQDLRDKIIYSGYLCKLTEKLQNFEIGKSFDAICNEKNYRGKFFCGWGYTRAQGLIEIKIRVDDEIVLGVQIQGGQYRHLIEVNNELKHGENWTKFYPRFKKFFDFESINTTVFGDVLYPASNRSQPYNKYNNNFLYRYKKIKSDAKVKTVLDLILQDVQQIQSGSIR